MIERVYEYGRTFEVKVETASKDMIVVIAPDINEGFVLLGHGLTDGRRRGAGAVDSAQRAFACANVDGAHGVGFV